MLPVPAEWMMEKNRRAPSAPSSSSYFVTSAESGTNRPPFTKLNDFIGRLATPWTMAPLFASSWAVACPRPEEAPVTRTVLPAHTLAGGSRSPRAGTVIDVLLAEDSTAIPWSPSSTRSASIIIE